MNFINIPQWSSWSDFVAMGGQGRYVWSALGSVAVALLAELVQLQLQLRLQRSRLSRQQEPS